jgi:N6-adenosine-specific RNA methylase IME4
MISLPELAARSQKFGCIVADPPWEVMAGPRWNPNGRSRPLTYPKMTADEIASMPVRDLIAKDGVLFLWTINKYLERTYEIARNWGFRPVSLLTWCKPKHGLGLGGAFVNTSEFILYCRRGKPAVKRRSDTSWWEWKRGPHSKKPEAFHDIVESMFDGPYLELFARRQRHGWTTWGNEVPCAV